MKIPRLNMKWYISCIRNVSITQSWGNMITTLNNVTLRVS